MRLLASDRAALLQIFKHQFIEQKLALKFDLKEKL